MAYYKIIQPIVYWKADIPRRTKYSKITGEFQTQEDAIEALRIESDMNVAALEKQGYHTQLMPYSFEEN